MKVKAEIKLSLFISLIFFLIFFLSYSNIASTQGNDPANQFNQSQSINITGIASTIDQATINSYLNVNGDGLTWDVLESEVPQREQKTVEYFIYQDMTQMAANTEKSATFTVYIPEKNPVIKNAIIEIKNLVYNTQITAGSTVKIWNGTTNTTLLTTGAGPAATGENLFYFIYADATPALSYIRQNGTYTFTLYVKFNSIRQGENAKLILTYEYDSDSPRQIKTVRFFVGQLTTSLAVGSSTAFTIPPLNLPEGNVVVRDSFFETYIHLVPGGTTDEGISIDLDEANAISGTPIDNAGATTIDYIFLYRNIFDTTSSHTFNFKPTAGYAVDTVGTELVLTYEYDANSPTQLKTVKYLIGQDTDLYTTAHTANFQRQITLPENNTNIRSIYNRVSFAIAYGTGAGNTRYTTTIGVNSTIQGSSPATQVSYSLDLRDEQVSTSMILYNATNLYNLQNENTVICSVYSSAASTSYYTGSKGCELIMTYAFNSSSPQRIRTVDYFVGQNYNGSVVSSISFPFSFSIPENSYSIRDTYLTVYGFTGSATAATNTLISGIVVPGYVNQTCNFRNTGEARFDRCWDYVLDNVTSPGSYTAIFGSGVTRWFSSTITITYTYQIFYQLSVEHNATISYSGILNSINVSINFTSTVDDVYNMTIYNFANSNWDASPCQNISATANNYYTIWCNVTSNPTNYVSSDNKVRVRLNSTIDNDQATLKEEYVQFYIGYEIVNQPPSLGDRVEEPASPTTYSSQATYRFNITVNDPDGEGDISTVIFEFNGVNETVTTYVIHNTTARNYSITKTDLPANPSGYTFKWYANDSQNSWASVVEGTYVINKGVNLLTSLTCSPSSTVTYPIQTTCTGTQSATGDDDVIYYLYRDGELKSQKMNDNPSETVLLGAGSYVYKFNSSEGANWTANSTGITLTLTVQQNTSTASYMHLVINGTESNKEYTYPAATNATAWFEENSFVGSAPVFTLYRNTTLIGSSNPISDVAQLAAGFYNYTYYTPGNQNYSSAVKQLNLTIQKANILPHLHIAINGTEEDSSYTYENVTNATAWSTLTGQAGITYSLYRNTSTSSLFIGSGDSVSDVLLLGANIYYYVFNTSGNENYTSGSLTRTLTILQKTPKLSLEASPYWSNTYPTETTVSCQAYSLNDEVVPQLYRNSSSSNPLPSNIETIILGAGSHEYICNNTATENYTSTSNSSVMIIEKGNPASYINLFIDNQTNDKTISYPNVAEIRGNVSTIEGANDLIFNLYRNGLLIGSGNSTNQTVSSIKLGNGTYVFVYNTSGGANWTSGSSSTRTLYVLKGVLPLHLTINGTEADASYNYENITNVTGWGEVTGEDLTFSLYRNSVSIELNQPGAISDIQMLGAGTYTYIYNTSGGQNYTSNSSSITLTITKKPIKIYLALNGSESNKTYVYPETINATAWKDATINDEGSITLYRNGLALDFGKIAKEEILLGNGTYNYSATFSASNYTAESILSDRFALVLKGLPPIYLAINGTQGNVTYTYPAASNSTGWLETVNKEGSVELLRNGISLGSGDTVSEEILLAAGEYNYSLVFQETQNYSFNSITKDRFLKINKAQSTATLTLYPESPITYETETVATCTETNPEDDGKLWRNNTDVTSENNTEIILPAGAWEYVCNVSETQNYTSASDSVIYIVNKKSTTLYLWLNRSREDKYYLNKSYANFTVELVGYPGKPVELWTNYTDGQWKRWDYGDSPLQNITQFTSTGTFNFTGNFSGDENYTASYESWIVTVGLLSLEAKIESFEPKSIKQGKNSTLIGNCSCTGGTCNNVYIEILADDEPIPNVTGYNLQVNGSGSYYLGSLTNSWATASWNITGWEAGLYAIKIKCNSTETGDSFSDEQMLQVNDSRSPNWSNNLTQPQSPTVYEPNKNYQFNLTWYDNVGISKVLIEHNFTTGGPLVNSTMNNEGYEYFFSLSDLPAGTYVWRSYANDTSNNWNKTDQWVYVVEKASTLTRLFLNGSESDRTYNVSEVANFTVALNVSGKTVYLETNMSDWVLQSSVTPLYNYTKLNQKGIFNVTGYFLGDENYTASSQTYFVSVIDEESPSWSSLGQNSTWIGVGKAILLFANWSDNFDLDYAWLETNETRNWENKTAIKINLTQGQTWSNFTWQNSSVPAGWVIGWRVYANDSSGNENKTDLMFFFVNASEMWVFSTNGTVISSSAVGDINDDSSIDVVFGSFDKNVYALNGSDGSKIWNFSTNGMISSSPALASITSSNYLDIFIGSYDYNLYALNGSNGRKIWNFSTGGKICSSPAIVDVNKDNFLDVIFGSDDGKVYALNGSNGNLIWSFQTNGKVVSSPAVVNLTVDGYPIVFIGSYDYNLYALNGSDGSKIWNFSAQEKIESSPAVDDLDNDGDLEVVFGSYDNKVYVLDANTGEEIWNYTTGNWITASPVILDLQGEKKVVIGSHDSYVYCFNSDGSLNWTFKVPTNGRAPYLPSVADLNLDGVNDVAIGSTDGRVYILDGREGSLIWSYNIGQYIYTSPALVDLNGDGNLDLALGSTNKNEYVLDPPSWPTFGGNERRTRIFDNSPPDLLFFDVIREGGRVKIVSFWKEKFSNLAFAIVEENSTGLPLVNRINLRGMIEWVNYSFIDNGVYYGIKVFDEYGNSKEVSGFVESETKDRLPPTWSTQAQHLQFNYSKNQVYLLNLSWFDESGIEEVIFENNFTGEFSNESMEISGNFYSYSVKDLPAGTYVWRSYARDVFGNWNSTPYFTLEVLKKNPEIGFSSKEEVVYPGHVDVKCVLKEGDDDAILKLIRNGDEIEIGKIVSDEEVLRSGLWQYSCIYPETQNYTQLELTKIVEVKKGVPELNLKVEYEKNSCPAQVKITAYDNNSGDEDISYRLYSTDLIGEGSYLEYVESLRAGIYSFTYNSSEGENWTSNSISKMIIINDSLPPENLLFNKKLVEKEGLKIYSLWQENCSSLAYGIIRENSTGEFKTNKVKMSGSLDWVNYTIPEKDIKSREGCVMFLGFICLKRIFFEVEAFDNYSNSAKKSDDILLILIFPIQINLFRR
jgi:outer membrane protein assembly factor BamB